MRNITDSDIFILQNETKVFSNKINEIIRRARHGNNTDILILNRVLSDSLQKLKKVYNESIILKAIDDIEKGKMILVELSIELNIPRCMPFVRYKADSGTKILINLTPYLEKTKDNMGNTVYDISVQRLYPIIVCSYLTLNVFNDTYALPSKALHNAAFIWASMFNKVLSRAVALGTNRERYDAFMYFAMKFFCDYIMQTPKQVSEDVARAYLARQGRKSFPMLDDMNAKVDQSIVYSSFRAFCSVMFNNEITNIRGIVADSSTKTLNEAFYINRFIDTFTYTSLFSLGAFPYFLFSVIHAALKTRVVNDLAFQDIITDRDYNVLAMMNAIF